MKRPRRSSSTKSHPGISAKARPQAVARQKVSRSSGAAPDLVSAQSRINTPFNPNAAVLYGQFVTAAYSMYDPICGLSNGIPAHGVDQHAGFHPR
jgi:hypothetical protein